MISEVEEHGTFNLSKRLDSHCCGHFLHLGLKSLDKDPSAIKLSFEGTALGTLLYYIS